MAKRARLIVSIGLIGAALVVRCSVADIDYAGKTCTTTCPSDLACVGGICTRLSGDASQPDVGPEGGADAVTVDAGLDAFAPTIVQAFGKVTFGAPTQVTVTSSNPQTKGNLNLVAISWQADGYLTTLVGITDTDNNSYVAAAPAINAPPVIGQAVWYAKNIHGGTSNNKITLTTVHDTGADSGASDPDVRVIEIAGLDPSAPFVSTNEHSGNGSPDMTNDVITPGPALLVAAGVLEYGFAFADAGAPFQFLPTPTSSDRGIIEYEIVDSGGTYSATAFPVNPGNFLMQLVALH